MMRLALTGCLLLLPISSPPSPSGGGFPLRLDPRDSFERAVQEFEQAQRILAEQPDRARRLFLQAAQRFESLAASGIRNGRLEYDLGNCYLQAGDVGRAILHYRRAQRLIPGDPMLKENLRLARQRRLTNIEPRRRSAVLHSVFFMHYDLSAPTRMRLLLIFYFLFWAAVIVRLFLPRRVWTVLAVGCAAAAIGMGISLGVSRWSDRHRPDGVVTEMDVVVYKGPGIGYQRQFEQPLQPGVEFTRLGQRGAWWKIELPDGKQGWIEGRSAALVPLEAG
ncbi:MAG: hypothetical protein D6788_07710 [Planctomycetota bacterium]|nr:MAG: hypothetical protein D6788_07710 [Planctomycetota bacterium]